MTKKRYGCRPKDEADSTRLSSIALQVSGAIFLVAALNVYREREGEAAEKAARRLFGFSILYLFMLFAALLVERIAGAVFG